MRSPIVQALLARSLSPPQQQVYSPLQGAAQAGSQILQAFLARKFMKREQQEEAAEREMFLEGISGLAGGYIQNPASTGAKEGLLAAVLAGVNNPPDIGLDVGTAGQDILSGVSTARNRLANTPEQVFNSPAGLNPQQASAINALAPTFAGSDQGRASLASAILGQAFQGPSDVNPEFITLAKGDDVRTLNERDPQVGSLLQGGYTEVKTPAAEINLNQGDKLSVGQEAIDKAFAPEYISWQQGGAALARKDLTQLDKALEILQSGENVTGVIGALPDFVQPFINEKGTIAKEAVAEIVQRNLKAILGAQFTEKEGEKLIERAFNPKLPEEENIRRVRALLSQMGTMAAAKQGMVDYFNKNGTLRGYEGPVPSINDIQISDSTGGTDFSSMSADELAAVDLSQLGADELRAYLEAIGGQ